MVFLEMLHETWVSLELQREPQGPARVASEKSGLFKLQGELRHSSRVTAMNRAVSRVLSGNSVFLSICQRGVRPLVEFRRGIWAFSRA